MDASFAATREMVRHSLVAFFISMSEPGDNFPFFGCSIFFAEEN
jgi:hypothetical protein